ncbi:DUF305 domain-containing protein [Labedella phragmitis]|uniref:DUF305 domain-containing protein n=1 Tax=Labedella phragmitis TaxID=2498849 RepID=A0A3S3ZB36_9MICO|nr:DUF305 domain-containing protein [Labedella phragmitis]RWZ52843.1 DUF305 domain-containing protein [Labedella phragmitis]
MNTRRVAVASTALATALVLAGCSSAGSDDGMAGMDHGSSSSPSESASSADVNDADTMFASAMVMHHEQAIEMSDVLLEKEGVNEEVAALAEKIKAAQEPEIEKMNSWLADWGVEGMEGMDHGGMMSEEDMAALEAATGAEASTLFLEQMIEHHQGAVSMAQGEVDNGQNADAVEFAEKIVADQTEEIVMMQELLASL